MVGNMAARKTPNNHTLRLSRNLIKILDTAGILLCPSIQIHGGPVTIKVILKVNEEVYIYIFFPLPTFCWHDHWAAGIPAASLALRSFLSILPEGALGMASWKKTLWMRL